MLSRVLAASLFSVSALADQVSLDCPLRQIGLDYAKTLQPFRSAASFQQVADALNGAEEAQDCSVAVGELPASSYRMDNSKRVLSFAIPTIGLVYYVDPTPLVGSDENGTGSEASPFLSLDKAVSAIRLKRASLGLKASDATTPQATVVLRAGIHFRDAPLELGAEDSRITFQGHPGDQSPAYISGAVPIDRDGPLSWTSVTPPARSLYEYRAGSLIAGFDALPMGSYTYAQAEALCTQTPTCAGFTYNSTDPAPTTPMPVSFKFAVFFTKGNGASSYVKNTGYLPGANNLWVTDLTGRGFDDISALRVNDVRQIRARYPNVGTAELLGAMQIDADNWQKQSEGTNAAEYFNPAFPMRNESAQGFFQTFKLGIGGPCAERFTPQASYWCSNTSQGGGPGPYSAPVGMTVNNGSVSLPHTPYTSDTSHAFVHAWRAGRWFSWVFGVGSTTFNPATGSTFFNFTSGGNQGSRGGDSGYEFFVENVFDELDNPAEFYFDRATQKLYLWYNSTGGTAPPANVIYATTTHNIIRAVGTQANPVVGTGFLGLGFIDSSPYFMGPHGTPSGGDWAVERMGALFFEGTRDTTLDGNYLARLDGNAVFFSGYNRNASLLRNEFFGIGETAISQWGYTDGSPVPGMGFDATAGNQPRGTVVRHNLVHEVGIWTKQNSFYFQSESFGNVIDSNIAYNGPRAGINFDDGMGGGSVVSNNVLFNFCRESSDHGPFNSWNRQVYLWDGPDGQATSIKQNDTITRNWILANYHSSMAIDNDDGSAYYDTHHNVFISASEGAAYGGNSLKSDFGGYANYHHDNLDLFFSSGFGICAENAGFQDGYYNNVLYKGGDGNYGGGQSCSGPTKTTVYNNTIYSPTGAITECGMTLQQWQAQDPSNDPISTAAPYPADQVILNIARNILGL